MRTHDALRFWYQKTLDFLEKQSTIHDVKKIFYAIEVVRNGETVGYYNDGYHELAQTIDEASWMSEYDTARRMCSDADIVTEIEVSISGVRILG